VREDGFCDAELAQRGHCVRGKADPESEFARRLGALENLDIPPDAMQGKACRETADSSADNQRAWHASNLDRRRRPRA
jgi:hypothetical protein